VKGEKKKGFRSAEGRITGGGWRFALVLPTGLLFKKKGVLCYSPERGRAGRKKNAGSHQYCLSSQKKVASSPPLGRKSFRERADRGEKKKGTRAPRLQGRRKGCQRSAFLSWGRKSQRRLSIRRGKEVSRSLAAVERGGKRQGTASEYTLVSCWEGKDANTRASGKRIPVALRQKKKKEKETCQRRHESTGRKRERRSSVPALLLEEKGRL